MLSLNALVIEEEYLIAADIEQALRSAGASEVTVFRNIAELHQHPVTIEGFDIAVVEAKLGQPEVISFAQDLLRAGVAVVVSSADRDIQTLFEGAIALDKPFDTASLLAACTAARGRSTLADLN